MKRIRKFVGGCFLILAICLGISGEWQQPGGTMMVSAASYQKKTVLKGCSSTIMFSKKIVSCESTKSSVAKVTRVNSRKIKITGIKKGTAKITVKFKSGSKKYYKVTVENPKISSKKLVLDSGESARLKVTGTTMNVKWKSSDTSVVTIGSSGMLTAREPGTAKITATVGGKKKLTCTIMVNAVEEFTILDEVKMLIERYGSTDSSGDVYIEKKEDEYTYRITYDRNADTLEYYFGDQQEIMKTQVYMVTQDPWKNQEVLVRIEIEKHVSMKIEGETRVEILSYEFSSNFKQEEYHRDYEPFLEVERAPGLVDTDFEEDYAKICLRLAFLGWTDLLQDYTGYRIRQIGFSGYEY